MQRKVENKDVSKDIWSKYKQNARVKNQLGTRPKTLNITETLFNGERYDSPRLRKVFSIIYALNFMHKTT